MSVQNPRCSITSCKNFNRTTTPTSSILYFKVPALNTKAGKKWAITLKDSLTQYPGSFLCNLHFHQSDIVMKRHKGKTYAKLKDDAVPKLMLSNGDSAMDVDSVQQDEEVIQYVDIEAIKKGSLATRSSINRTPVSPVIIRPRLSTEISLIKVKIENTNKKSNECDQCKANEMQRKQANERCCKLEEINQALNQQIKYLLEKIRMQETTVKRTEENSVVKATDEKKQSNQAEPANDLTHGSQSNDEDASNLNENDGDGDGDGDRDLSVDCIASEESSSNDPKKKAKKKRRPPKNSGKKKDVILKLDVVPPNCTFFKCGICVEPVEFKTPYELGYHIKENHSTKKNRQILPQTMEQILSKQSTFECYICKLSLNKLSDVRQHVSQHAQARSEKCKVCDERCTAKELNWHMCDHSEKTIQCEYCTKSFDAIVKLSRHIESEHEKEKIEHRCNKCCRFFAATCLRDLHEKHHKAEEKLHVCKICDKAYSSIDKLSSHLHWHSIKNDHLCSECGKGFKGAYALKSHTKIHTARTIKCPECPGVFLNKTKLNYHLETHMDKKIKCNQCSAIFGTRASLSRHTRLKHQMTEPEKKYACTFCPCKFFGSNKLKVHMRKHNGEKPYVCEYCPRRYAYQQDFKKHLQTHVGDDVYKCSTCDKGFLYRQQLQKHSLEHYRQEQNEINSLKDTQKE